jgi:hypothetical protein
LFFGVLPSHSCKGALFDVPIFSLEPSNPRNQDQNNTPNNHKRNLTAQNEYFGRSEEVYRNVGDNPVINIAVTGVFTFKVLITVL